MNCTEQTKEEPLYRPAHFWIRAAAYLIDITIAALGIIILNFAFIPGEGFLAEYLSKKVLFTMTWIDLADYMLIAGYFSLTTWYFGATLGKKLLGLQVISTENRVLAFWEVLYREVPGRFLSTITVAGYFMATGNRKHQALHDMLSDTQVVYGQEKIVPAAKEVKLPVELYAPDAASEYGL